MYIKKQDIKKETLLLDGRLLIKPLMEKEDVSAPFESIWAKTPPKMETDDEYHVREEINIVVSGKFEIEVGEETYQVEPGDVITVPSNVRHRVVNPYDEEAEWIYFIYFLLKL